MVAALNALHGGERDVVGPAGPAQLSVHRHLLRTAREARLNFDQLLPHEAAAPLLGPGIDYAGDGSAVEPCDAARLTLPSSGRDPVDLAKVLGDDVWKVLINFDNLILASPGVVAERRVGGRVPSRPYLD
eukprot:251826-Pyramimonas_sp.AAC.1